MFLARRPSDDQIRDFLDEQKQKPLSYRDPCSAAPAGFTSDHNCIKLGNGPVAFQNAVEAMKRWEMFNISWLDLCWPEAPIETGSVVAVLAHHLGFWSLNACRSQRY